MSGTYAVTMGDRGRLVVPVEARTNLGLTPGTPLLMLETIAGLVVMTRDQAKARLRQQLAGTDLVASLLKDRRNAARQEDDPASTSTITTTP